MWHGALTGILLSPITDACTLDVHMYQDHDEDDDEGDVRCVPWQRGLRHVSQVRYQKSKSS